jgi:hypothetical protein
MLGQPHLRRVSDQVVSEPIRVFLVGRERVVHRVGAGQWCARALLARIGTFGFVWIGSLRGGGSSNVPSTCQALSRPLGRSCLD